MKECILRESCDKSKKCKSPCGAFIQLQGMEGSGGKQADALIPSEYGQTMLSTSKSREDQSHVYRNLEGYVKTFKKAFNVKRNDKQSRLKDLFFYSKEKGTGKTETSCALLNEFLQYAYLRSIYLEDPNSFVKPIYFLDMPALQELYLKANRGNTPKHIAEEAASQYWKRIEMAKTSRLVVFDEMGIRDVSEAFRTDIHDLINYRTGENLTSIYTSNVAMKELIDIFDERIYDRVRRYTIEFNFIGESKRGIM